LHRDQHWSPYMAGDAASPLVEDGQGGGSRSYGLTAPLSPTPTPASSQAAPPHPPYPPRQAGEGGEGEGSVTQQSDRRRQQPTSVVGGEAFPYFRRRGPVALIGVSTAIATPPFMATGKVGEQQIARIARMLGDLRTENVFRVVMIHHPPLPSARHKCLIDAIAFQRVLAAAGAELVIHGHDHVHSLVWIAGNGGAVSGGGVPSSSGGAGAQKRAGGCQASLFCA